MIELSFENELLENALKREGRVSVVSFWTCGCGCLATLAYGWGTSDGPSPDSVIWVAPSWVHIDVDEHVLEEHIAKHGVPVPMRSFRKQESAAQVATFLLGEGAHTVRAFAARIALLFPKMAVA